MWTKSSGRGAQNECCEFQACFLLLHGMLHMYVMCLCDQHADMPQAIKYFAPYCFYNIHLTCFSFAAAAVVPPGFFLPADGTSNVTQCTTGTNGAFKAGWGSDAACTACGLGIYSEALTSVSVYDPYTDTSTPSYVAVNSSACCKWIWLWQLFHVMYCKPRSK
jgi:hypothetical protein